jgi:hypothetical protein
MTASWERPLDAASTSEPRWYLMWLGTLGVGCVLTLTFLGLLKAGRAVMCETHDQGLTYCAGYTGQVQR